MRTAPGLRTTATMMYGTVETDEERLEHLLRLRDASGRDRRVHGLHHLELSARAHGARRLRSHGRRLPPHARHRAPRPRQLRQPAGVVGDAGRQGGAVEPRLRRERHGQRHDRGERRARGGCQLLHGRSRDRQEHRGCRVRRQAPQHALRDSRRSDLPGARTCRGCWSWRRRARRATRACPDELRLYPARSRSGKTRRMP